MTDSTRGQFLAAMKDLLASGAYSDLVVSCGSDTYHVHKAIVCPRVGFFAGAMRFDGKESAEQKVDLSEDEQDVVKQLIRFLYEHDYDPVLPTASGDEQFKTSHSPTSTTDGHRYSYEFPHTCKPGYSPPDYRICPHHFCTPESCKEAFRNFIRKKRHPIRLLLNRAADQHLIHAKMYHIADKYDVKGLKELSQEKFARACTKYWARESFVTAAQYACTSTVDEDTGLRDIIVKTIADHMELLNKAPVMELLSEYRGLAIGVLKARAEDLGWMKE